MAAVYCRRHCHMVKPMNTPEPADTGRVGQGRLLPLYAAGFVTAFGAHSIAASLGGYTHAQHASLLALGLLLAVYDGAEVVLKPVFGSLADRIGARPVLLGGLLAFAAASAAFVLAGDPAWVGLARFGQGAAAAAFSPAAGVLVAAAYPKDRAGPRVRPLRRLERPGLHPGPGAGRCADRRRRLPAAVHHPGGARCRGRRVGCPGGAGCAAAAAGPADRGRPCPPAHQPRVRAADPGAGRRHRRPVGRGGVPAGGRRRPRAWAVGDRRDRVAAGRGRRPDPTARRTCP